MIKGLMERCCPGLVEGEGADPSLTQASNNIDRQLQEWKRQRQKEVHLLLLGPGESGKSTILKQMRILHNSGYNDNERQQYKVVVHRNIVDCMCAILTAMENMGMPFNDSNRISVDCLKLRELHKKLKKDADCITYLKPCNAFQTHLTPEYGMCVKRLWEDRGVQKAYDMRADYQIYDCAQYFFDNIERITERNYLPTIDDILCTRLETTKIVEAKFNYKTLSFKMYDVGGQRTQRSKWIHCFDDVTAIIFIIALSEYNLRLAEDNKTNRMKESMLLFSSICNMKYFTTTPFILFLNKTDIFQRKIEHVPITVAFPEYSGPNDYDTCKQYIQDQLVALNKNPEKSIFPHFTNATDTNNIKFVFDAVVEIFLEHNLKSAGLV
ncbi:guanine nucleotide-binding protein G(i) subunit alpha-3-like isoform X1 [Bolinopsis microptera]|uniref:guanine nucleotide-binding protein G(i) subunit alpha-3-like isoform X1 n=1 Tax=Bolinopsis microptera TaxID=2820187 RepID=UPI00307969C7